MADTNKLEAAPAMAEMQNHGSIGNYKGVMLCNRPNEPGDMAAKDR